MEGMTDAASTKTASAKALRRSRKAALVESAASVTV